MAESEPTASPNQLIKQVLEAAGRYYADGLVVIPLEGKIPQWKGWQTKTTDEGIAEVRRRARNGTLRNIGIVAGRNSDNLFQGDIDGLSLYYEAIEEIPELKATWTILTGSEQGVHIYGRVGVLPPTTTANFKGEHLEIRFKSDGQQCVAPPSIHPDTGKVYKTLVDAPIRHFEQDVVERLIAFIEARRPARSVEHVQREVVIAPSTPGQHRTYALAALDGMVTEVARLTNVKDDPQNDTMHTNVVKLAAFAQRGDLSRSEVFSVMENAMRSNGYISGFGYHAFSASFESGWNYGISSTAYVPQCYQEQPKHERRNVLRTTTARIPVLQKPAPEPPPAPPLQVLTLWQNARYLCVCPEYALIHRRTLQAGTAEDFTAGALAGLLDVTLTTAQKMIDKTLRWRLISELTANFQGIEDNSSIPGKNTLNSKRGPKAVHYRLTPHLAESMIKKALPDYVQELMEAPDPGTIYTEEAELAGVEAANVLERVSSATAETLDALEVTAKAERAADRKAYEQEQLAELDATPFTPDVEPCSVRELRTQQIETLIATEPDRVWKHSELMWVAGAKRGNVGKLINKSNKIMPALVPTFVYVTFSGGNAHAAMQAACRVNRGAPAAWLDERGEVIGGFGRVVPAGTKGGLINIGKVYVRREASGSTPMEPPEQAPVQEELLVQEPTEEVKQKAKQSRARSVIMPRLKGCLLARGWKYTPGPYGYWERGDQTVENTFDDMVHALLMDQEWARQESARLQNEAFLTPITDALGANVRKLA